MRLPGIVRILRPGNAAMTALAVVVAAFVAADLAALASWRVLVAAAAAFAFAGAGNAANDLRDVAIDRRAHPGRPLVTGEVTTRAARVIVVALYAAAVFAGAALSVDVSVAPLLLVLGALVLMESYERWLKATGLPGNVAVALLTGAPFVLGGLAVGVVSLTLLTLAGLAALATLGREVLKDVEDWEADLAAGRRTLPRRVGLERALATGAAALFAAVALSPVPAISEAFLGWPYLAVVLLADAGFAAAALIAMGVASRAEPARRAARAQRLVKAGMLVALVAFVAGRLG